MLEREIEILDALLTVTDVEVGKKLDRAIVKVSVMPSEKAAEAMKILARRAGEFQFKVMREINIKPMPKIVFELDRGSENAAQVEKALLELEDDNGERGTKD